MITEVMIAIGTSVFLLTGTVLYGIVMGVTKDEPKNTELFFMGILWPIILAYAIAQWATKIYIDREREEI